MSAPTPIPWAAVRLRERVRPFEDAPLFPDGLWAIVRAGNTERVPIAVLDHADDHHAPAREQAGLDAELIVLAVNAHAALVAAAKEAADELAGLIAGKGTCGDPDAECPLQDAHKPWSTAGVLERLRAALALVEVKP